MAGLKINICFWYLDKSIVEEILKILKDGDIDPISSQCKDIKSLSKSLIQSPPDLIISDFDLPDTIRHSAEESLKEIMPDVPMIYLVGEKNEGKAAETLKSGVWDYILKNSLLKLVPSVYSSQKYGKVLKISKESKEQFRALAENSPDIIMRFDRNHRHLYVNRVVESQIGIKPEAFLQKTHEEMGIFPENLLKTWEKAIEKVFKSGKSKQIEFNIDLGNGPVYYEWRLYPEMSESNVVESVIGVARDITSGMQANLSIKESEERLNLALHATSLGLWDWNILTNKVYFSPMWFSMLGYAYDELPHEFDTWRNLLHPEDLDDSVQLVQNSIDNRDEVFETEFRMLKKDGSYLWILSKGKAVAWDKNGNTIRLTGTHENIAERKKNEVVQQVLFNISNAIITSDNLDELYDKIRESLGLIIDTTNCFLALYKEENDTLTLPFMRDEKDEFTEFPARKTLTSYVIETGKAQLIDREREKELTRQGLIEPVGAPCESWLGVPLKLDGKIFGVFAVQSYSEDVLYTESDVHFLEFASDQIAIAIDRKQQQDDIRISQETQRRIFEASPDPMIVVNTKARIIDFNSSFLDVFNVEKGIVYGHKVFDFLHPEHWRSALRQFNETWEKGYLKNMEFKIIRPDGVIFDGEVSTSAIFDADGAPESMVMIIKNISDRKEAERRLMEAKEIAEESDRLKTAFLSNMSHEIRTPMNAIVGFSDLLSDPNLSPEERKEFINQINQGADNLMHLIDDIIDIAKIEAGQITIHISECDVNKVFKELYHLFTQNLKRLDKSDVELKVRWDWPEENLLLLTDEFRLKQVLTNLLGNAVKFTEHGYIEYGIKKVEEGVMFFVKDTGIGIKKEKQAIIFDRFRQGHETKTKLYGGTGLGLAISKNITELLGGDISINSISGKGSEFIFILPGNVVTPETTKEPDASGSSEFMWSTKKLLIAEDDHSNFLFIREALRRTGIDILWTKDGEETLELFRNSADLDLVLMDVQMPLKDGYECTRIIKKERPELPVIAQTAYAMAGERELSRAAGCDDYISKPIKIKDLLETIAKFIT